MSYVPTFQAVNMLPYASPAVPQMYYNPGPPGYQQAAFQPPLPNEPPPPFFQGGFQPPLPEEPEPVFFSVVDRAN
jgi:hypothetical protein